MRPWQAWRAWWSWQTWRPWWQRPELWLTVCLLAFLGYRLGYEVGQSRTGSTPAVASSGAGVAPTTTARPMRVAAWVEVTRVSGIGSLNTEGINVPAAAVDHWLLTWRCIPRGPVTAAGESLDVSIVDAARNVWLDGLTVVCLTPVAGQPTHGSSIEHGLGSKRVYFQVGTLAQWSLSISTWQT